MTNKTIYLLIAALSLFVLYADNTEAAQGRLDSVQINKKNGVIYVSSHLTGGLPDEFAREIKNGMDKDLFYYIVLKRKQKNWIDEEMVETTVKYSIKFDILKSQFNVVMWINGSQVEKLILKNIDETRAHISKIRNIRFFNTASIHKKYRYYISVKAVMQKKVPYYIDYLLFFIPMLEIDTPWEDSPIIKYKGN